MSHPTGDALMGFTASYLRDEVNRMHDEECLRLARYFYPDAPREFLIGLAFRFQEIAEGAVAACPHGKPSENDCIACNYTSTSQP